MNRMVNAAAEGATVFSNVGEECAAFGSNTEKQGRKRKLLQGRPIKLTMECSTKERMASWHFWRNMIVYFCLFSLVGHLLVEFPYCWFSVHIMHCMKPSTEVLTNPFKPFFVYGIAIVICVIVLEPIKDWLLTHIKIRWLADLVFYILNVFIGMAAELTQGFLQNQPVNGVYPLWDFTGYPGNIMGQAWIVNDILFGVVITFAVCHMHPMCKKWLDRMSEKQANTNVALICAGFAVLTGITYGLI